MKTETKVKTTTLYRWLTLIVVLVLFSLMFVAENASNIPNAAAVNCTEMGDDINTNTSDPITASESLPKAAVSSAVATKYWLELKAYPPGSARSLWLFAGGSWRHLDNPNVGTQDSVQEAFCNRPDRLEVVVWYSGSTIEGLVVRSK